jgi:hypothetical protein
MLRKTTGDIISDVGWKSAENYLQLWFHTSCWNIVETLLKHGLTWVWVQMLNTLFCRLNQCCSQLEFVYPDVNYIVLLDPPAEKCLFSGRSPCGWCQVISTSPLGRKISPWPWGEEWPWEHHGDHIDTASCGDVERDETRQLIKSNKKQCFCIYTTHIHYIYTVYTVYTVYTYVSLFPCFGCVWLCLGPGVC